MAILYWKQLALSSALFDRGIVSACEQAYPYCCQAPTPVALSQAGLRTNLEEGAAFIYGVSGSGARVTRPAARNPPLQVSPPANPHVPTPQQQGSFALPRGVYDFRSKGYHHIRFVRENPFSSQDFA